MAKGREFARTALRDWGWGERETAEDVLLLVSELLTNAVIHAGGCHELVVTAAEGVLRVEVFDGEGTMPRLRTEQRSAVPGGHGLYIVQRLSDRWGVRPHAQGKAVWAEVEAVRLITGCPVHPMTGPAHPLVSQ
ncbi:ATP-binding protein [Streptomyces sp. G-G2]|uniref:ATP-binding protein n=1 Tax=Streptomyces sp. G-G2 TaxID=3046201 RepID=UPI0024BBD0E8|nr:ATP-binding protein [Streptomyces sp. G-G2]MDJ0382763.1 ATP-binding protein [Streptomyces sp. G-G2]